MFINTKIHFTQVAPNFVCLHEGREGESKVHEKKFCLCSRLGYFGKRDLVTTVKCDTNS